MRKRKTPDKLSEGEAPKRQKRDTLSRSADMLGVTAKVLGAVRARFQGLLERGDSEAEAERIVIGGVESDAPTTTEEILANEKFQREEAQKEDLIHALRKNSLQSRALYHDPDPWRKVSGDRRYQERQHDLETVKTKINEILKVVGHDGAKKLRMIELGPGTGKKITEMVAKILEQIKLNRSRLGTDPLVAFDCHLRDVSPEMLFGTFSSILSEIIPHINNLPNFERMGENHPWRSVKKFIDGDETTQGRPLKLTGNTGLAAISVQKAFYKYLRDTLIAHDGRTPVQSLIKFALARYFGVKKSDHDLLFELDREVDLPFEVFPHKGTFEDIEGADFQTTRTVSTIYNHGGNEAVNQFPGITVEDLYANNLLKATPEIIRNTEATGEAGIRATYVMFSFQTNEDGEAILDGYDTPTFNHFVSHLFVNPKLVTFVDPESAKVIPYEKCFEIQATYEEDPDNLGYFGTVHRLVFTKDVNVIVRPDGQAPQIFLKNKGEKIMLLPSYKPSVKQMRALCEKHGLQVVKKYLNEEGTNAVFVIRRKTKEERDAVERESSSTRAAIADVLEVKEAIAANGGAAAPENSRGRGMKRKSNLKQTAAKRAPRKTKKPGIL